MFMDANEQPIEKLSINTLPKLAMLICVAGIVVIGFIPAIYNYIYSLSNYLLNDKFWRYGSKPEHDTEILDYGYQSKYLFEEIEWSEVCHCGEKCHKRKSRFFETNFRI
jgi:hypothetical protein